MKSKLSRFSKVFLKASVVLFVFGCASSAKKEVVSLPAYEEVVLDNGLRMIVIPDDALPRFQMTLQVLLGSRDDLDGKEGLSNLVVNLLDQGTKTRSANKIAEELNQLGTEVAQVVTVDMSQVSVAGLVTHQDSILDLYKDVLLHPSFDPKEIDRIRNLTKAEIQKLVDRPAAFASMKFREQVFGPHPNAMNPIGKISSLDGIARSDLVDQYQKYFRPDRSWLVLSGRISADFKAKVKAAFSEWRKGDFTDFRSVAISPAVAKKVLFTKSDLAQSEVRIGHLGIVRNTPDFLAARIATRILGSGFSSRLMDRVRDQLGLTYGINSDISGGREQGTFVIETATRFEKTGEIIAESLSILNKFVKEGVTSDELKLAKSLAIGQFPLTLETPEQFGASLLGLRLADVPDTYLRDYLKSLEALSVSDVNKAIRKYLHPDRLVILVFSNRDKVLEDLKKQVPQGGEWIVKSE